MWADPPAHYKEDDFGSEMLVKNLGEDVSIRANETKETHLSRRRLS